MAGWSRKGSKEEDEVFAQSFDAMIDVISDADRVAGIELHTGRNVRDQVTTEQVEEYDRERKLRRMPNRN